MGLIILILLIAVPIGEIAVFVQAGEHFGLWPTLAAVIGTAVAGTALLRHQGFDTLRRIRDTLDRGEMPVREMFDGLCVMAAGALLLTPGFITDTLGFILFLPPARLLIGRLVLAYLIQNATVHTASGPADRGRQGPGGRPGPHGGGPIIDGDYEDLSENETGPPDRRRIDPRRDRDAEPDD